MSKRNYRQELLNVKRLYMAGEITYEQLEALAQPIIDDMNADGAKVAKVFGRRFNKVTFTGIMR